MKKIVFWIFLLLGNHIYGQTDYIDVNKLPVPDCSGNTCMWKKFDSNTEKLLVIPDKPSDTADFNYMFKFMEKGFDVSMIKKESNLTDKDYNNALIIYGEIGDYKNWKKFNLPFQQVKNGFKFNEIEFTNVEDGFFYISTNRMVYSGNSMSQIWKQQSTYATYYDYMIFEKGLLSKLSISEKALIDVKKIRETNYNYTTTKYFDLFIDKRLSAVNISDSVVIDICNRMQLDLPEFKIKAFIHGNPNAARLFANFYSMAGCDLLPQDMKYGTVQIDGIHVAGKDIEFIKHESFHYIWNKLIGDLENEFFNEGIQEYYQQLLDPSRINKNIRIAKKYSDFDITNLVTRGNQQDVWGGPSDNNWPIAYNFSGLFVKFLIDRENLITFKTFITKEDKSKAFVELYKITDLQMIEEFNNWVIKQ